MADASSALGAAEVAGAWVNPSGMGRRTANAAGFGQFGTGTGPGPGTPNFGAFGYLAVTDSELAVIKGKRGLVGLKMSDDVVTRVPRSDVASVELGDGKITAPLTITFGSGGQWDLEVARAHRRNAERVIAELTG